MYVELLKKTILFEFWQEHEQDLLSGLWNHRITTIDPEKHRMGETWPQIAHSMIGRMRMDNLQMCMETVLKENIEGDFIETGVWRGGACIFMSGFLKVHEIDNRKVWLADSFQGLPAPNTTKYPKDKGDILYTIDYLRVSLEEVQNNFRKYDLLNENVKFLKGWFKDTLPTAPIEKLAILRLDGDLYESTMDSLSNLYDKVSNGGFIIIDDYNLPTCESAVTDFRRERDIKEPLIRIDNNSAYWRK
ncbi:TylF/MycF family methyltransferase [Bacillus pfraonensis]|uniref:TylF/MycF family methyltransferase n=1 Tax=Bacillus pfraonensis TaxID=2830844 RepID=UPI003D6E3586